MHSEGECEARGAKLAPAGFANPLCRGDACVALRILSRYQPQKIVSENLLLHRIRNL